jgi:hypothetical protein
MSFAAITGTGIGTAQVMTFAIPLAVFGALCIAGLLSGRSGRRHKIEMSDHDVLARTED